MVRRQRIAEDTATPIQRGRSDDNITTTTTQRGGYDMTVRAPVPVAMGPDSLSLPRVGSNPRTTTSRC